MKIVVCVKMIPDISNRIVSRNNHKIKSHNIARNKNNFKINPLDEIAIETALRLRDKLKNVEIIVVSMGPLNIKTILKRLFALYIDQIFLLSDPLFAGADTLATGITLTAMIKKIRDVDLILCGQLSCDSGTGHIGPGIAELLKFPNLINVKAIDDVDENSVIVKQETDEVLRRVKILTPCVLSISKGNYELRLPTIKGLERIKNRKVIIIDFKSLKLKKDKIGKFGSPTQVKQLKKINMDRHIKFIKEDSLFKTIDKLLSRPSVSRFIKK